MSYEEEEDTCVCTQGTKHVSYEEEEDPPHTGHKALSSSYLNHMYPPPHTGHKALSSYQRTEEEDIESWPPLLLYRMCSLT